MQPLVPAVPVVRKARKQYTITKKRESWSSAEHDLFVRALEKHGRDWRTIEGIIKTKNIVQIRSHAQKHFMKALKSGAHIPPPRPKKKRRVQAPPGSHSIASASSTRPNFGKIYHAFADIIDPHCTNAASTTGLNALDKEVMKLLITNLEKSLADQDARHQLLAAYRKMQSQGKKHSQ